MTAFTPVVTASARQHAAAARLHGSAQIRRVFRGGGAARAGPVVVHGLDRGDHGAPRVAVIAGRAVGNAVARNRVKRRLRAAVAAVPLQPGFDYVVVGRPDAVAVDHRRLLAAVQRAVAEVAGR